METKTTMTSLFSQWFSHNYKTWLQRRNPPNKSQHLHQRNIFIFPSKIGFGFLLTAIILWLLGTNYQNNLILVLAFLLLSLLFTCILYTYANFSGLSIQVKNIPPCFVGDTLMVEYVLTSRRGQAHNSIYLGWKFSSPVETQVIENEIATIAIPLKITKRGEYRADRLHLWSVFPLGIIRTWAYLDMDIQLLAYPNPIKASLPQFPVVEIDRDDDSENSQLSSSSMSQDVSHLRPFMAGDSLNRIAWKTYAKGQGLNSKVYEQSSHEENQLWLRWEDFPSFSIEERLSKLCFCVLEAEKQKLMYGLELPHTTIELGNDDTHKHRILRELAIYNLEVING